MHQVLITVDSEGRAADLADMVLDFSGIVSAEVVSSNGEATAPNVNLGVYREKITRIIEESCVRHGAKLADLEGTLDDADAILLVLGMRMINVDDDLLELFALTEGKKRGLRPIQVKTALAEAQQVYYFDAEAARAGEEEFFRAVMYIDAGDPNRLKVYLMEGPRAISNEPVIMGDEDCLYVR